MHPLKVLPHTLGPATKHLFNNGFINSELSTCHCWQGSEDPSVSAEPEESLCVPMNTLPMVSKLEDRNETGEEELHFRHKVGSGDNL